MSSSSRTKSAGTTASGSAAATNDKSTGSHPGFVNLGNTCFFNSTLQALSATQSLHDLYQPGLLEEIGAAIEPSDRAAHAASPHPVAHTAAERERADIAELIAARSKSPVLRLADEEHARSGNGIPSAALEASLRAVTSSGIVANPTPADIASIKGQINGGGGGDKADIGSDDVPLNTAFRHVMEKSWDRKSAKGTTVNPKQLLSAIARKYDHYADYKQQDGHELLRHLLDSLRMEELDVIKRLDPPKGKGKERDSDKSPSLYSPLVDNLFCGKLLSAVVCEGCRQVSHTYEDFYDISLSIRPDNETEKASKRQRMRSMADRWRRGGPSRTAGDINGKPVHETLMALRSDMESLSDTEQPEEPVKRSASRLGIMRPRSAADRARIDANSKEGTKKFIKKQMHGEETSVETDMEALSLDEGARTPFERRSRAASGGGASSLLRAVSGRRTPSAQSRSASPSTDGASNDHAHRSHSFHRHHHADRHKGSENRQQQYLSRILAETAPAPQAPNISALFWGRRSSIANVEDAKSAASVPMSTEDIEEKQAGTGLARAMHQFTNVEVLDGNNTYACKRCWRLLNPPSAAEDEKQRLRRLRRGKTAEDSERSSDDQSSSDEEAKEQQQKMMPPAIITKSRSSAASSVSGASLSTDARDSLKADDKALSSSFTPPSSQGAAETTSITEKPSVVVTTENGDAASPSLIAAPTPLLRAPKPQKAPLQLGVLSSDDASGVGDSSDDVMTDAEDTDPEPSRARSQSIRYADDSKEVATTAPRSESVNAELRRKRSAHSLQRRALKRLLIAETPKVLVFHFKRFQATGRTFGNFSSSFKKIDDFVSFPEYLDVKQWVAPPREEYDRRGNLKVSSDPRAIAAASANDVDKAHDHHHHHHHHRPHWMRHHKHHHNGKETPTGRTLYRLYAVVVHQGSMSGGHYTSYVLSDRVIPDTLNGKEDKAATSTDAADPAPKLSSRGSLGSEVSSAKESQGMPVNGGEETKPAPVTNSRHRERRWVHTSDKTVRVASIDEVLRAQAYMLFYEQV